MTNRNQLEPPFVSVVIPVYNAAKHVTSTLDALFNQTYPKEKLEIIVVDNDSTDDTINLLSRYNIELLINTESKNPYISRNMGLANANGDIIAFLDITNQPKDDWLERGVKKIQDEQADLVGGHISFKVTEKSSLGEWYDAISFLNAKQYIDQQNGTVCGNLLVKKKVVDSIGFFPESSRSGMDMYWTKRATSQGFKLIYGKNVIVLKKTRGLKSVLKKKFRVGKGHISTWKKENMDKRYMWWETITTFSPPSFDGLRSRISNRGMPEMNQKFYSLWLISWAGKIAMAMGRTVELLKKGLKV